MVSPHYTDAWLTTKQVAQRYQVSVRCVQNWTKLGIIPFVRLGRVLRFNLSVCDAALSKHDTK